MKTHEKQRKDKINEIIETNKFPKIVKKPWGEEHILSYNEFFCFKKITINKGYVTSLQYHEEKRETTVIHSGKARIWLKRVGEDDYTIHENVEEGMVLDLPVGDIHRIEALEDVVLYEASSPEIWDVVRLEDSYGREGTSEA